MPEKLTAIEGGVSKRESVKLPPFLYALDSPLAVKKSMGELYDAADQLFHSFPIEPGMFTQEEVDAALARIMSMIESNVGEKIEPYDYYEQFYYLLERAVRFPDVLPSREFTLEAIALLQAGGVLERVVASPEPSTEQ
ncbi:MAG: hypothetical protein MUF19_01225 [Candidatus Pacebacteria bacterium]|jgi:hypothetical protein|nr:hypothetical protein [Candidatus Paceibacterota bacterium]